MNKKVLALCAATLCPAAAMAATTGTSFDVTATVNSACSVSAANLGLGTYVPSNPVDLSNTTSITVNCTLLTPYNIGIGAGGGSGATTGARKMTRSGNSETLSYSLFRNVLMTQNWGNVVGTDTVSGIGTGLGVPTLVYGSAAAGQNVPAGSYTDTVTVTVTY